VGKKKYETRSWAGNHYGSLIIHAAAKKVDYAAVTAISEAAKDPSILDLEYPTGAIVAIADLVDYIRMDHDLICLQSVPEIQAGLWQPGRYAWKIGRVQKCCPISAKGRQGLWRDEDLVSKIQFNLWSGRKASLAKSEEIITTEIERLKTNLAKEQKSLQKAEKQKKPDTLEVNENRRKIVELTELIREIEIWKQLEISKRYCASNREVILEDKFFTMGNCPLIWVSEVGSDDKWLSYFPSQLTSKP
jgi:hypothetical protein